MVKSLIEAFENKPNPFNTPKFGVEATSCAPKEETQLVRRFGAAAASEDSCEFGSAKYYTICGFGGVLSCGVTHTALVPLDLVKCRIQVEPEKYKSIVNGFKVTLKEDGVRGLAKGWAPTLIGYIAGVFCAIVSHPADSVVSLLNKDSGSTPLQALQKLGPKGVWKGLFARILMIGTLTALQWFIYDSVKVYFKLPRPPPPEMPESLKQKLNAQ
uniref:Solute carrier family 25 member 3 n=1 Tax=Ciona savignyi TaxID=51511 RepID=H2YHP4_CIOSA